MDYQTKSALWLARSPFHRALSILHRKLDRYMDLAENWNNGDERVNGEAWLIRTVAPHLAVAFDVGANLGRWSQMLAEANPKCLVHAFEPSPSTFLNLEKNAQSIPGLKLHQLGLGDREGVCAFNDYGENSGLSSFASRRKSMGLEPVRVIKTPVSTFDQFCAQERIETVDFVKIDTEGYEMSVLRGMEKALGNQRVAAIQFEYGGTWLDAGETLAAANQLLQTHGYQLYKLRPASLERVQYDCRRYECFKYSNFVALKSAELASQWKLSVWPS
jgi:FkbM family methyltransferase